MTTMVQKGADEKFCSECGAVIKAKAEICPHCGVRQMAAPPPRNLPATGAQMDGMAQKGADEKFCSQCGATIKAKAEICPHCGVRQMAAPLSINFGATASNGKSRITAAILAFFLGGLGVHKFYLGQIGWGVVYLIFCWTFIPAIVAFIEFIIFLTMSDETFNQKYGQA